VIVLSSVLWMTAHPALPHADRPTCTASAHESAQLGGPPVHCHYGSRDGYRSLAFTSSSSLAGGPFRCAQFGRSAPEVLLLNWARIRGQLFGSATDDQRSFVRHLQSRSRTYRRRPV